MYAVAKSAQHVELNIRIGKSYSSAERDFLSFDHEMKISFSRSPSCIILFIYSVIFGVKAFYLLRNLIRQGREAI